MMGMLLIGLVMALLLQVLLLPKINNVLVWHLMLIFIFLNFLVKVMIHLHHGF